MPKIILTEEQHTKVVNLILNETIQETQALDEGVWEKIKYGLSKLGRYKAGGKIFGKGKVDQQAAEQIQSIISKKGNEVIASLDAEIKQTNPKFPNNEKEVDFLNTILSISAVYDSIVASTQKNPDEEGYLPIDAANGIINDLRDYVKKFLDVDLKAVYSVVDEIEGNVVTLSESELNELNESWVIDEYNEGIDLNEAGYDFQPHVGGPTQTNLSQSKLAGATRDYLQNKRGQGDDFDSERMKTLKSNKLPLLLSSIGTSLGAFGWLTNTEWFKHLFDKPFNYTDIDTTTKMVEQHTQTLNDIKPGEGLYKLLGRVTNHPLNANSSTNEFIDALKQIGGGDAHKGVDMLCQNGGVMMHPQEAAKGLHELINNPTTHQNINFMFQDGTPDSGSGKLTPTNTTLYGTIEGRNLASIITKMVPKIITNIVTKTGIKTGAGYAAAKGLGSVLGPIGVGLLAAGALVKIMRMKGQKQSRAKTLNDLFQLIRNLDGGTGIVEPQGEIIDAISAQNPDTLTSGGANVSRGKTGASVSVSGDDLYNTLKNLFQFIVNNRNMLGSRSADNVGTGAAINNQKMKAGNTYTYNGQPVTIINPDSGNGRTQVRAQNKAKNIFTVPTTSLQRMNETQLFEGEYIRDKRMLQFLNKNLSYDKLKSFESLMSKVEKLRNKIRNIKPTDKVLSSHLKSFNTNPIMLTDFKTMFNLSANNPQAANSLKSFIDDLFITLYSGKYKFGNMIDKMSELNDGNINKVNEVDGYNMGDKNKSFIRDAQDRSRFKANLLKFLSNAMNLFQYLSKLKKDGRLSSGSQVGQQNTQPQGGQQNATQSQGSDIGPIPKLQYTPVRYESIERIEQQINEGVERIKKIMFGLE